MIGVGVPDLRLEVAMRGDLEEWKRRTESAFLDGLKAGVREEGRAVQEALRHDVTRAELGEGVANAWRLDIFPPGAKRAWNPSAFLHSRAAHIVDGWTRGEPIRGRGGGWMAVPIPGSPADEVRLSRGQSRVAMMEKRFGELQPVKTRRGTLMLIAMARMTGSGRFTRLSRRTTREGATVTALAGRTSVPLFWIVREVRLRKALHWPEIAQRAESDFGRRVESNLKRRLGEADGGVAAPGAVPAGWD